MNKLVENLPSIFTLVGLVISAVWGPSVVAKVQGKMRISEVKTEGDSNAESMYVQNMSVILGEYKEQVSGFRNELENVRKEFASFKDAHNKEVAEYQSKIAFIELQIENKDDQIEELETEIIEIKTDNIAKEGIILALKGEV